MFAGSREIHNRLSISNYCTDCAISTKLKDWSNMGYIYAEVLVTALVPESFFYQVPTRDISLIEFPQGGFAYRFFEHTEKDAEKVRTLLIHRQLKRNNCTAWTYFGKEYTLEEFKKVNWLKEKEKEDILWQMETNNYTRIVNTICDGWFPLQPNDVAIEK